MESRYLYKAKRADDGAWVQGYYVVIGGRKVIIKNQTEKYYVADEGKNSSGNEIVPIRPATLCQCTGLQDANGTLIWENDIVTLPIEDEFFAVCWEEDCARFSLEGDTTVVHFDNYWGWQTEVVGNTFDNRELLGEEETDE